MSNPMPEARLREMYRELTGTEASGLVKLPPSGSYRQYYRLTGPSSTVIGAYNLDKPENEAFFSFSKHFKSQGLPVPGLFMIDPVHDVYLMEDLGDTTLLNYIQGLGYPEKNMSQVVDIYKKVIGWLPAFQVKGGQGLDYSVCYPRHAFDRQSMMWDLNYFKYYFLKLTRVPFNEQALENDFNHLVDFLLSADCSHFLYRDFQSRNVMIRDGEPYFIDYQGGRKGALHYDIASVLFEAKTSLPVALRQELLDHYLVSLNRYLKMPVKDFEKHFYGYVYIRLMQAMGAYGFRGLYEKKELFLQSIPPALNHLRWLLENVSLPVQLPELTKVWEYLAASEEIKQLAFKHTGLEISVNSFSYRRGIPLDETSNGGGFVFDCRSVHNPGRYEEYKAFTGKDAPVIEFFAKEPEMKQFLEHVFALVDQSVDKYLTRGFTNLMVNFGCTGGQHRSVYSAENLCDHLKQKFPGKNLVIKLRHREIELNNGRF